MNRVLFTTAFILGAAAVIWMGSGFIGADLLALTVTAVIGGVYIIGIVELLQFRRATDTLSIALAQITETPANLKEWISLLDPSLRNAVELRIEGERVGLPAPVFTPYLVGLLIMLGLLGTFVGMVETLQGAVTALQGSTELEAIRNGLAAPIAGLSLAFGTSVAGVAASAMLGLNSTLSRRERMLETRNLDSKIGTVFKSFSLNHNRQVTFQTLQQQAQALPLVAERLNLLADSLLANQASFHEAAQATYRDLADSVSATMTTALSESGRLAGASIRPVVEETMGMINSETQSTHRQMLETTTRHTDQLEERFNVITSEFLKAQETADQARIDQLSGALSASQTDHGAALNNATTEFAAIASGLAKQWHDSSTRTQADLHSSAEKISELLASSDTLIQVRIESEEAWQGQQAERLNDLTTALREELSQLRTDEAQRQQIALEQLASLEQVAANRLSSLGSALEEPMTRLIETASETPRAAAEVIGRLREEISNNMERDNQLLEERRQVMEQLNTLAGSLEETSSGQREAVDQLVDSTAGTLSEITANIAGSAAEMASLGEAFTVAVNLFGDANGQLIEKLNLIEQSLANSTSRSDEQMAYYVAQAREIIDQSMSSQSDIIEQMRQLKAD